MKRARLEDSITGENFDLAHLLEKHNGVVIIGRREKPREKKSNANIFLGEGSKVFNASNLKRTLQVVLRPVSREHATITHSEGMFCIHDHSKNGTRVGSELLSQDERIYLENGDILYFGKDAYGPVTFYQEI